MKTLNIYRRQWLSLCILSLISLVINSVVLSIWFNASLEQLIVSDCVILVALLVLHWRIQSLQKKAEMQIASELLANQTLSDTFPVLAAAFQQSQNVLNEHIDKIKKINSELEHKALQDNLTSLQNRSAFRKDLTEFLQRENQSEQACLCLIRSTELATINHQRGRIAGDQYLLAVAEIVQYIGHRFSTNYIYRLSSSDYAILIPNATTSLAPILGKELKQLFDNFQLQMSMESAAYTGITFVRPGQLPETPLTRADLALAKAQTSVVNGWYLQEEDVDDVFQGESHWRHVIQYIIESHSISFAGQAIQPLNMAISNYIQIIPRFIGQNQQPLPSETVYAMAMRHGIMSKLEELVVEALLQQHKTHSENLSRWGLNLSANALFNSSFMIWLERILLKEQSIAPNLVFEIDEEILDCHLAASIRMFEMLRRVGSRSCISKFGRGLGSFRLYRELRPDYIKLDSGLIDAIERDSASQQFIRMIVEISHRLGCVVIAEGVESMSQRETLERMYVDGIQGQLVSKTISISK